jgi:hypothetical protein
VSSVTRRRRSPTRASMTPRSARSRAR